MFNVLSHLGYNKIYDKKLDTSNQHPLRLTNTASGQQPCGVVWWGALDEDRFHDVLAERQGHNGLRTRSDDHALDPEPDEGHEGAERFHDVGVVGAAFSDHSAQFCVAVSSDLKQ